MGRKFLTLLLAGITNFSNAQCVGTGSSLAFGQSGLDRGQSIIATQDGGYLMAVVTDAGFGQSDWALVKLNSDFSISWSNVLGTASDETGDNVLLYEPSSGGYLVIGFVQSGGRNDYDLHFRAEKKRQEIQEAGDEAQTARPRSNKKKKK